MFRFSSPSLGVLGVFFLDVVLVLLEVPCTTVVCNNRNVVSASATDAVSTETARLAEV